MKKCFVAVAFAVSVFGINKANAQINLGQAIQTGIASLTYSDADAEQAAAIAVKKMDSASVVAGPNDGYTLRLNRLFSKHANDNGLNLNYKVYITQDVNAFATADGSVRVFSGLMDIMDDNQLLAVIGHETGHVFNHHSKEGMKAILRRQAVEGAIGSASKAIASFSQSQWGQIGNAIIDNSHTRKQETVADDYSYDFMKRNGYDVNAVESAFTVLANMSGGGSSDLLTRMMNNHPDPQSRADRAKAKAQADGLYKPYVQQPINNKATTSTSTAKKKTTTTKTIAKKSTKKK